MNTRQDFIPILLGSDINVYGMARSFHEGYGIHSHCIGKGVLQACTNTSILTIDVVEPNIEDDDVFVSTMLDYSKADHGFGTAKLLLVPCGDNYIKLMARNQDALRGSYVFNCIDADLLMQLSIKENFYKVCSEHGLLFPKTMTCSKDDYASVDPQFGYPLVIKPSNSVAYWNAHFEGKKKVFVAQSAEEFRAILEAIYASSYQDHLILQEFIPGDDSAMRVVNCYCDTSGKVDMIALGRVLLEEHTPEGIGSYAAIVPGYDESLNKMIIGFLEGIGFRGYANFDMKYDERDGRYKLFEMNLRQGRSSYYVTAAGTNLVKFLVDDVVYGKPDPFTVVTDKVLYTIVPKGIIKKYVKKGERLTEAEELMAAGKVVNSYLYDMDANIKRRLQFARNQMNYFRKYRKCFNKKGLWS